MVDLSAGVHGMSGNLAIIFLPYVKSKAVASIPLLPLFFYAKLERAGMESQASGVKVPERTKTRHVSLARVYKYDLDSHSVYSKDGEDEVAPDDDDPLGLAQILSPFGDSLKTNILRLRGVRAPIMLSKSY